ncbi:c-type cytochrome [Hydrogenothermus marinus]|uniref:Complex iron-sulfur molybdoenzyme family reductase subunit gamma n=1 Tax=Hydrogenothermus marinus TaxID=133270 RepID=A0A3M0BZP5_9AQUI|nr:c-type cytochrome [Hydrogenothermus marinus]RMA96152.1 complex iron-sulfur molybdoenzyme family reductase subunit gamma [Hydrogenothermus marinus]
MKKWFATALSGFAALTTVAMASEYSAFYKYEVLNAKKVSSKLTADPSSSVWKTVPGKYVYLYPQVSVRLNDKKANSLIPKKSLQRALVKVAYNNEVLAVYVQWKDNTPSTQAKYNTDSYADGVSIEVPNKFGRGITLPYIGMGDENHPVTVYLQKTVAGRDYQKVFVSEGFGSLTEIKEEGSDISMKYNKQKHLWTAVFVRPLKTENSNLKAGLVPIAFAIWDGKYMERDGNKSLSRWKFIRLPSYSLDKEYLKYVAWGIPYKSIGNPARGKQLMKQNGCNGCHRYDDQQTAPPGMAPNLSDIGGIANAPYLRESIINPSDVVIRNLNPNRHYNKFAKPDKFNAYPNNDMYTWYTVGPDGKKMSKMPPYSHLSEKDINDIVAYLKSLRNWKNFK